jgi:hypothetical protein
MTVGCNLDWNQHTASVIQITAAEILEGFHEGLFTERERERGRERDLALEKQCAIMASWYNQESWMKINFETSRVGKVSNAERERERERDKERIME